jgi:hypothetical protein
LAATGKLRIGDDWNAITIIALSQDNPLKAIAEFVENSIDAGVRRNDEGAPDFRYVATHICDSIKRQLKSGGAKGIQGEFGIGLLSFWTVGEVLAAATAPCTKCTCARAIPAMRSLDGKFWRRSRVRG